MELLKHLENLDRIHNPIRIGLVGCGQMGSGMIHLASRAPGIIIQAIADIEISRPINELLSLGISKDQIIITNQENQAEDWLRKGKFIVTEDALLLSKLPSLLAVIEATGNTEIGAKVAWHCILNQKNIVMLNVETDVTVGYFLNQMADKAGCIYTVAAGDEPAVCKMLYDFSRSLGFEVVTLGKGKNNIIDYEATPDSCAEEAKRKNMNPKMLASFKDGTKTMVEMAAVSNATGLLPDIPGMHGPKVEFEDLEKVFIPQKDGGILSKSGCVDYSTGAIAPGVFAIITTDEPRIQNDLAFVSMGNGPYYKLVRPFHLCNIETPLAVAEAVIYKEKTVVPKGMYSEVTAVAKRNLNPGDIIGGIGSADVFHRIYTYQEAKKNNYVPMGICQGAKVLKPILKGENISYDNVALNQDAFVYQLRKLQDSLIEVNKNGGE